MDLRRFEMAGEHLEAAASLYQIIEDDEGTSRVLMKLSALHGSRGDVEAALETDRILLELLTPDVHEHLYVCFRVNYASNLLLAGYPDKARDVLVMDEERYPQKNRPHFQVRVRWLQGKIAAATGEPQEAERAFLAVREHFVERQHGFNCALVCLHLAGLYHQEARWSDLYEVAAQAVQLFESFALHQEALAALTLLRDAAAAQQVTAEMIQGISSFLHEAQRDPGARFHQPN